MGGSTTVQAPAAGDTASQALQAQLAIAPAQFQATQQFAPQYNDLYNQIAQSSLFGDSTTQGLLSTYGQATPILQNIQSSANTQQAQENVNLVNQLAPQAVQAYQQANPQLTSLQNQLTNLAETNQNPESMVSGVPQAQATNWAPGYQNLVQSTLANTAVNPTSIQSAAGTLAGYQPAVQGVQGSQIQYNNNNATVNQLNATAQQQLALGSSMSQQQGQTVANQVLSNYNNMGRANDPTAIAGLATGLDTYGQQLLQQRESNAATAGSLLQQQQGLGLQATTTQAGLNQSANLANQAALLQGSGLQLQNLTTQAGLNQGANLANQSTNLAAQQSNLASQVSGLGDIGQADSSSYAQMLQASLANQQAGLQVAGMNQSAQQFNANYQGGLLSGAAQLAANTAQNPYALILGQSGALGSAAGASQQAGATQSASAQLENMYNPFSNGAFSTIYGGNLQASQSTAANNAAITGGAIGAGGSVVGAGLGAAGTAAASGVAM